MSTAATQYIENLHRSTTRSSNCKQIIHKSLWSNSETSQTQIAKNYQIFLTQIYAIE